MPFTDVFPQGFEKDWDIELVIDFLKKCDLPHRRRKEVLIEICRMRDLPLTADMVKALKI